MIRDGILLIDKPSDYTSFDVVARLRGMLQTRKIGHAGTLDPMATGVLPLFVGRATKCCDILPCQDKRYTATFKLGLTTDTQDITGSVTSTAPVTVGKAEVEQAVLSLAGELWQLPPMYSAVQVKGQRLYTLARQGIEVEREKRRVVIYEIALTGFDEAENTYTIDVLCSKGTYIRTLAHDIGQSLGCGATLTKLRRTMSAGFDLEDCVSIDGANQLAIEDRLWQRLLPVERVFESLPAVTLTDKQIHLFKNGVRLDIDRVKLPDGKSQSYRVVTEQGRFLATASIDIELKLLICDKLFVMEEQEK